jgi:hypothetical protein
VLTTDQKGAVAESAVVLAAIRLGAEIYRPLNDGTRYDLILDVGRELLRVQCKYAPRHGDVVAVRCYSTRRARDGLRKRQYTAAEVDVIAAYCPEIDRCFLILSSEFEGRTGLVLRLAPTKNNQHVRVNWAEDFSFEARLTALLGP